MITPPVVENPCDQAKARGGTEGCEFFTIVPPGMLDVSGSCFVTVLVNPGSTPVTIGVEHDGVTLDAAAMARIPKASGDNITYEPLPSDGLPAGQMALLFLAQDATNIYIQGPCPEGVVAGLKRDPAIADTGKAQAFIIKTQAPVTAYNIFSYPSIQSLGIASATLLLPSAVWGTNYIAADPYQVDVQDPGGKRFDQACQPFLQLMAREDDTQVSILPNGILPAGVGVVGAAPGESRTYKLDRGEVIQFMQPFGALIEQRARWGGSPIRSDKPISVFSGGPGGTSYTRETLNTELGACPASQQQLIPVSAAGSEYVAVRHRDRDPKIPELAPWTMIGAVDGTRLEYDPAPPAGAPETINNGQEVIFNSAEAFSVRSADAEHPFYLYSHMPGGWVMNDKSELKLGQPEFVNVLSPAQWLTSYVFLTDPKFPNTHFIFSRKKAEDGTFKDVTLGCLGTVPNFQPVGKSLNFEYARVDVVQDGKPVGNCSNGPHNAKSEAPFSITVWGWGPYISYAYPAGGAMKAINSVVVDVPK
jgi:hypothetical protein